MNIPEILIGTEALPFLEWFKESWNESSKTQATAMNHWEDAHNIRRFLSSDFNPIEIPELFEGWVLNIYDGANWFSAQGQVMYWEGVNYQLASDNEEWNSGLPIPATWEQFISDCKRAGITLTYK